MKVKTKQGINLGWFYSWDYEESPCRECGFHKPFRISGMVLILCRRKGGICKKMKEWLEE